MLCYVRLPSLDTEDANGGSGHTGNERSLTDGQSEKVCEELRRLGITSLADATHCIYSNTIMRSRKDQTSRSEKASLRRLRARDVAISVEEFIGGANVVVEESSRFSRLPAITCGCGQPLKITAPPAGRPPRHCGDACRGKVILF